MHLPSFGARVDRAAANVLAGLLGLEMFGSGTRRWFVRRRQQQRVCKRPYSRKKKRWAARILKQHRQKMLSELDVGAVLPHLVYDRIFSLGEYKEILGQESSQRRTEIFLDRLSSKGPAAFCSFCSVLEDVCPHLLTSFLLDGEGTPLPPLPSTTQKVALRHVSVLALDRPARTPKEGTVRLCGKPTVQTKNRQKIAS